MGNRNSIIDSEIYGDNMKLKLIISSYNLDFGGIEKSLINMVNSLDAKKYDITLVLENKEGVFLKDINKNIKVIEYHPSNTNNKIIDKVINLFKRVSWILKHHNKYDVSICYATYSLSSNFIARSSSKKRLFYIHSNYYEVYNHDESKVLDFFDKRNLDDYSKIVFVSNESRESFLKLYPKYEKNSFVINNIVNITEILNLAKEECKIPLTNKYIGVFVGRLEEKSKKITRIVGLAKNCNKDYGFLIIGDGPDKDYLSKIIKDNKLKNIVMMGSQKNPYKYIARSNFLILTSDYEGNPVVFNEAIILNKPILTTINTSDNEIEINNNFGIVCSPNELQSNLNKIIKFKSKKLDFNDINSNRISKIERLIDDVYEED